MSKYKPEEFDFTEILRRVEAAKKAKEKIEKMRFRSNNTNPVLTEEEVNFERLGPLTKSVVDRLIESKITHQQFVDYMLTTPLLGDREIFKRKADALNMVYGLRRGNNLTEDRMELILDLLGANIYIESNKSEKEGK